MAVDALSAPVILLVVAVLGYALCVTSTNRAWKAFTFLAGTAALGFAIAQSWDGGDGVLPVLYRTSVGLEDWLPNAMAGNNALFAETLPALTGLFLVFAACVGLLAAISLLNSAFFNQVGRYAVVALLAAIVGGGATARLLSTGFGGYRQHDVYFGRLSEGDILDGDTVKLGVATLRLAGIDAPEYQVAEAHKPGSETDQRCYQNGEAVECGMQARAALLQIAKDEWVVCARIAPGAREKFGRPLVTCTIQAGPNTGLDLGMHVAAVGFAVASEMANGPDYGDAVKQAQAKALGIWGMCALRPEVWREDMQARSAFVRASPQWDPDEVLDAPTCERETRPHSAPPRPAAPATAKAPS